jgi:hypothetical protein
MACETVKYKKVKKLGYEEVKHDFENNIVYVKVYDGKHILYTNYKNQRGQPQRYIITLKKNFIMDGSSIFRNIVNEDLCDIAKGIIIAAHLKGEFEIQD